MMVTAIVSFDVTSLLEGCCIHVIFHHDNTVLIADHSPIMRNLSDRVRLYRWYLLALCMSVLGGDNNFGCGQDFDLIWRPSFYMQAFLDIR